MPHDYPNLIHGRLMEIIEAAGKSMKLAELVAAPGIPETTVRNVLNKPVTAGHVVLEQDPAHSQWQLYRVPTATSASAVDRD